MAWQARSYSGISVNTIHEQRIAVAKLGANGLEMPKGLTQLFEKGTAKLLRPRISFDPENRLWLTARESGGQHVGWRAAVWVCGAGQWTHPGHLRSQLGLWRPAPMVWTGTSGYAADRSCSYHPATSR